MRYRVLFTLSILLTFQTLGYAQRLISKADTAFKYQLYNTASTRYQKGYTKMKKKSPEERARVLFQIAECYRLSGQNKKAIGQYKRAIKAKYASVNPIIYFHLANLQRMAGLFDDAVISYQAYIDLVPEDTLAQIGLESCLKTQDLMNVSTRYEIVNLKKINSKENDWAPRFYDETGQILTFTSTREGGVGKKTDEWTGSRFSDIFIAKIDEKGEWSKPELIDANGKISTPANEGEASFCNNGRTVYYTLCANNKKKANRCLIYTSNFDGNNWSDPKEVNINNDSVFDYIHPYITPDGSTLYFTSNLEGGCGDLDVWYAKGQGSEFGVPVNMGTEVNTPFKEAFPFLRNDTTFYFSSTGHSGLGGYDIFKSTFENSTWTNVENVGFPINSNADDFGIVYLPNQDKGMFSSNRPGGRGGDEIWSFYLPPILYSLSGVVRNDASMQFMNDAVVSILGSDGTSIRTLTNSKGFYKFNEEQIRAEVTYQISVTKKGFLEEEAKETTVGLSSSKDIVRDFSLKPVPKGPVTLPNILYAVGKWDLQEQYQDSLIGLIELLEKNPRLVIELASHTDARPIAMTNDSLSQYRAQSVVDYLILRGIHPERLIARGYGSKVPKKIDNEAIVNFKGQDFIFPAGTIFDEAYIATLKDKDYQEVAHQFNRRTEFSVLKDDFIPSAQGDLESLIGFGTVENKNKIPFYLNPNKMPEFDAICNGYTFKCLYGKASKSNQISPESALLLLEIGKITKHDFSNKEGAFDEDGNVLVGQTLTIKEIKIGNFVLRDVVCQTVKVLPADILINQAELKKLGEIRIDEKAMIIEVK